MDEDNKYKIENRLLAKQEFLQLDKELNRFNIFEATDMGRREIKHTKFLCYLLDPNESHGLRDSFLSNFITRISERYDEFPRILDLDFAFAEISSEVQLKDSNQAKYGSLDCLVKIPFRNAKSKKLIIAIENKIDAGQSENQLKNYKNGLEKRFPESDIRCLYLTYHDDDASNGWQHIRYQNVVIPSVKSILEHTQDSSSYLPLVLNDYIDLLESNSDSESRQDTLASSILEDTDVEKYISEGKKQKNQREIFGEIYVRHKKALTYLASFDNDKRSEILKYWNNRDSNSEIKLENSHDPLILKYESSNRTYLRFSVLTQSNREHLTNLAYKDKKWLDSKCPLAFEVRFDQTTNEPRFSAKATLTLGPVEPSERFNLLNNLYQAIHGKNFPDKNSILFTFLLNAKKEGHITDETTEYPKKWLEENIINDRHNPAEWILDVSKKINDSLSNYFSQVSVSASER